MAENKYLNLTGLQYYTRKLDEKKADIESPALTGTPTAPTADEGTATTQIATTEFVQEAIENNSLAVRVENKNLIFERENVISSTLQEAIAETKSYTDEKVAAALANAPQSTFSGILTSPNGTKYQLSVGNDGNIITSLYQN